MVRLNGYPFSAVLLSCLFIFVGCSQPEGITAGAVLVLSTKNGEPLKLEAEVLNGMRYAVEEINRNGGVAGKTVTLVVKDCQGDPKIARRQFRELAELSPSIIFNIYSHITEALVPVASELKIPQLATLATAEDLTVGTPYTFRYWPRASDESAACITIAGKLRVKTLGLVNIDNTYGNSVSSVLMDMAEEHGMRTRHVAYIDSESQQFRKNIASLARSDAIVFTCFPQDAFELIGLLREECPDSALIGPSSLSAPSYSSHEKLNGVYVPAPLIYMSTLRGVGVLSRAYRETTGNRLNHYSAIGYDVIRLFSQVVAQAGSSPEEIKRTLATNFVYPGLFGDIVKQAPSHHFAFKLYPARIKDGAIRYLE